VRIQSVSLFLVAAALMAATRTASADWESPYLTCVNERGRYDASTCYYASRRCWITETGLIVCVPVTYYRAPTVPPRQRHRVTEQRH
jgi:hypothetical protein